MKRRYRINKSYLIIGLSIITIIMAIGYAAFASNLKINGIGSISNIWDIEITGIRSNNHGTTSYNIEEPAYTKYTASFNTGLKSPGDGMVYEIEISNLGTLDGQVGIVSLDCGNNDAIYCYAGQFSDKEYDDNWNYSGSGSQPEFMPDYGTTDFAKEKITIKKSEKKYLYIIVKFDEDVTSMPDNLSASINLTLNYVQYDDGSSSTTSGDSTTPSTSVETIDLKGKSVSTVITGDGLYKDSTEAGRYVYKGTSPNNYIKMGDDMYRIIALESDGTLKLIKNESIGNMLFDLGYGTSFSGVKNADTTDGTRYSNVSTDYCYTSSEGSYYGCKAWGSKTTTLDTNNNKVTSMPREVGGSSYNLPDTEAYIVTYLKNWLSNNTIRGSVVSYEFNIGPVKEASGQTLGTDISQEKAYKWNGEVGLISVTDYVKANSNIDTCGTVYAIHNTHNDSENAKACQTTNWMANISSNSSSMLTINPVSNSYVHTTWFASISWVDGLFYNDNYAYMNITSQDDTVITENSMLGVYPVIYFDKNYKLTGSGTSTDPYIPSLN